MSAATYFGSRVAIATWVLCTLWSLQSVSAAPLPQASDDKSSSTNSTNSTAIDPFSTPEYLEPSTFTWEQCIYGLLYLFFGGVEVLHGYKYIRLTMLLAGYLVWSSTAVMIILIVNINTGVYDSTGVYFGLWLLVGIVGAVLSFYLWHVGIVLTGAYAMFVLVAVIFTAANVTDYTFRYTFIGICVVVAGYLTKRYERYAVIIATSFGGAYLMMFGLDMFVQDGFRASFDVILSQNSNAFHPDAGTWVMVACIPIIGAFGIVWELKHHEEPVGSWWFGHGARPLPPLPGQKPARKCCGITLARSAKDVEKAGGEPGDSTAGLTGSAATLVPPPTKTGKLHWANCFPCCGKRDKETKKMSADETMASITDGAAPTATDLTAVATSSAPAQMTKDGETMDEKPGSSPSTEAGSSAPLPFEKENYGLGHETIGHTGVHKVVIQREEREFSLDVDERL
ncbi:hypothetical protein BGZ58_010002 [Dissophora ornata]|nr:hypothetical protein BGZ58_010002 [Dissophora ornata]